MKLKIRSLIVLVLVLSIYLLDAYKNGNFFITLENDNEIFVYFNTAPKESPKCKLPSLNIWDNEIKNLLKPIPLYNKCIKHKPLTYLVNNKLFINQTVNRTYYHGQIISCQVAPVVRSVIKNDNYILGEYQNFANSTELIDSFVKVRCFNKTRIAYEYVHAIVHRIEKIKQKIINEDKLNVLIVIFDAVSLSSARRAMPKTLKFLKSFDNFYLFEKHHTNGETSMFSYKNKIYSIVFKIN